MKDTTAPIASVENRILASLPPAELQRISLKSESIELRYEQVIFRRGDLIAYVFFPLNGIISLLSQVDAESMNEVGLIGREGMVGIGVYLGARNATNMAVVQGNGEAQRMRTADFLAICAKRGELPVILRRFAQTRLSQVSQLAACYRFHQTEARLARWLLMTADRMATAEFQITQEFLSNMLGVRREAVNKTAIALDELGLISHSRGHISIIDRSGLEAAACSCYKILKSV